jgi:hypothetical protein
VTDSCHRRTGDGMRKVILLLLQSGSQLKYLSMMMSATVNTVKSKSNNNYLAQIGINIHKPITKLVIFDSIIDESVHGIEHNIHVLAVGEKLEERTKLGGGCLEQVIGGESSADHLSITSVLLSIKYGLFDGSW